MERNELIAEIRERIIKGLNKSYERLLEVKRFNNSVLVISEKGKIIKIKPEPKNIKD